MKGIKNVYLYPKLILMQKKDSCMVHDDIREKCHQSGSIVIGPIFLHKRPANPVQNWPEGVLLFYFSFGFWMPAATFYLPLMPPWASMHNPNSKLVYPSLSDDHLNRNKPNLTLENKIKSVWSCIISQETIGNLISYHKWPAWLASCCLFSIHII